MTSSAWASFFVGSPTGSPFGGQKLRDRVCFECLWVSYWTVISLVSAISLSNMQGYCPIRYTLVPLIISKIPFYTNPQFCLFRAGTGGPLA